MTVAIPCATGPADLWFSDVADEIDRARALCVDCPMRRECLRGALERAETCGVGRGVVPRRLCRCPHRSATVDPKNAAVLDAQLQVQMRHRIDAVLMSV